MSNLEFSIERPFGVYLFDYFNQFYTKAVGQSAKDFRFVEGVTPLSTLNEVIIGCITYFIVIFGGQYLLKNASPVKCKFLFQLHNAFLTVISFVLLVLLVEQLLPKLVKHGLYYTICSEEAYTQELELLYYLNYLVKYYELLDTVFLVIKKKKLEFLHYFHHSMTMALCYTQLVGKTTVSWVPIVLNLTVHVLMYYYYFRTSSGAKIWWKQYLTTMQIIQFIIDLIVIYSCTYSYYAYTYTSSMPNFGDCHGTETAAAFGCAILTSYLFLFINFYRITYNKKKALAAQQKKKEPMKSKKI
ncbi:GNS1/SUR4 family-domain-containing protein [Cokeromyces recurvatus]|uniref:GNS1/SUR4 family-domain-containing protein n=1 Tax=Cokeromyces recurvatus TaxID=90255 RepID=UPI00222048C2|nr:GNS1/SUR4 family-domain-containing protein [Cokeromyces recurvatus]KAI7899485.1 GNS1/SUR4 family-domain-containing protein [Cokeromyces recurvatus]